MFKSTKVDISKYHFSRYIESAMIIEPLDAGDIFEFIHLPQMSEVLLLNFGNQISCESVGESRECTFFTETTPYLCGKSDHTRIVQTKLEHPICLIKFKPCTFFIFSGESAKNYFNKIVPLTCNIDLGTTNPTEEMLMGFLSEHMKENYADELEQVNLFNILEYIHANFTSITVNELSRLFNKSKVTLFRYFQKYIGINLNTYIRYQKFKAMIVKLYRDQYDAITSIEHGFFDQSHFIKAFKKSYTYTPLQFIRELESRFQENKESRELFEEFYIYDQIQYRDV